MASIGLVRLTGDAREAEVQHEALDPICSQVFEEASTRRRVIENRPGLLAVLNDASSEDQIVVTKVRYLAQTMADGLEVLVDLVDRGVAVRVLGGAAAGEHSEPSFFVDQCREIAETRRSIRSDRIRAGLTADRADSSTLGRPTLIDDARYNDMVMRREQGKSIRSIAQAVGVSVGTVHNVLVRGLQSVTHPME
ncbi:MULTISPECIES: recombinase family protein [Dermacoccus]|uniref:Recombinase family protein n=2 Tax=Dermacoccus TaxID=57495 RepID=A0A417ZA18_9MICO|nr:recombinase family protein [Dermacoccus abyssi]RHW47499.1 recombinase family protein [Dermacoccus abyssi]